MAEKFNFNGQKFLLTYTHKHIDKQWLIDSITTAIGKGALKFIRACHETGHATGVPHEHTHVLVDVGKRYQLKNARKFDVVIDEVIYHPNFNPINTLTHWHASTAYIAKEDVDNADLLVKKSICVSIWESETVQDALVAHCKKPSEAMGIMSIYKCKPGRAPRVIPRPDRPWHDQAIRLVESKPDYRSIHWFYDPIGNTGKTWLASYLRSTNQAFFMEHTGGHKDFAQVIVSAFNRGWDGKCFILDLPRKAAEYSFYTSLEAVKNGHVTSLKYEGAEADFDNPHCFVFANFLPDLTQVSQDRWKIHEILPNGELKVPIFSDDKLAVPSAPEASQSDPTEAAGAVNGGPDVDYGSTTDESINNLASLDHQYFHPDDLNVIRSSESSRPDNILDI